MAMAAPSSFSFASLPLRRMCTGSVLLRLPHFAAVWSLLPHRRQKSTPKQIDVAASAVDASTFCSSSSNEKKEIIAPFPSSAYVHLPFCKKRCFYCDFAIVAVGERTNKGSTSDLHIDSIMESYVDLICTEMESSFKLWNPSSYQVPPLKTLFFGGGTPSLLPAKHISRIIEAFQSFCGFEDTVEISMEMDPGTFDRDTLSAFLDCGVNRISLGVQAFNESFLKECGRSHGLDDVYEAIDLIHGCGMKNWSLDLISSLPYQTINLWEDSLKEAIKASPAHLSVYDLQVEEGTKFGNWYKPGKFPLPDEGSSASFYKSASCLLREAGYEHYEISNYAKQGYQCQHNMVYWKNSPYYAFGLGSTSYVHGHRFSRPRKWKVYAEYVKELEAMATKCDTHGSKSTGKCIETMQDVERIMEVVGLSQSATLSGNSNEMQDLDTNRIESAEDRDAMKSLDTQDIKHCIGFGGDGHETTIEDKFCDTIMLSLRLAQGLDLTEILQSFGEDLYLCLCEAFLTFVKSAHAEALNKNRGTISLELYSSLVAQRSAAHISEEVFFIRLSDPEGFLLSNEIISSLFSALPSMKQQNKL